MNESLDFADRWLRDGLHVLRPALSVHQISVDMTSAGLRLAALRRAGVQATYTHLLGASCRCGVVGKSCLARGRRRQPPAEAV